MKRIVMLAIAAVCIAGIAVRAVAQEQGDRLRLLADKAAPHLVRVIAQDAKGETLVEATGLAVESGLVATAGKAVMGAESVRIIAADKSFEAVGVVAETGWPGHRQLVLLSVPGVEVAPGLEYDEGPQRWDAYFVAVAAREDGIEPRRVGSLGLSRAKPYKGRFIVGTGQDKGYFGAVAIGMDGRIVGMTAAFRKIGTQVTYHVVPARYFRALQLAMHETRPIARWSRSAQRDLAEINDGSNETWERCHVAQAVTEVTLSPDDAREWESLARAFEWVKRAPETATAWRETLRLEPDNIVTRRKFVCALLAVDGVDEAQKTVDEAPDAEMQRQVAWYHFGHGAFEKGVEAVRKAMSLSPGNAGLYRMLASRYLEAGKHADALTEYKASLDFEPESIDALRGAAQTCLYEQRIDEAKSYLRKLLDLGGLKPQDSLMLARLLDEHGLPREALEFCPEPPEGEWLSRQVRELVVNCHLKLGEYAKAAEVLGALDKASNEYLRVQFDLAFALAMLGRHDESAEALRWVSEGARLRRYRLASSPWDFEGDSLWQNALTALKRTGEIHDGLPEADAAAAAAAVEARRFDDAVALLEKAVSAAPSDAAIRLDLVRTLAMAGRYDKAAEQLAVFGRLSPGAVPGSRVPDFGTSLKRLRAAIEGAAPTADLCGALGAGYAARKEFSVAADAFGKALDLEPESVYYRFWFAWCLAKAGRSAEALAQWRELRTLDERAAWEVLTLLFGVPPEHAVRRRVRIYSPD